MKHIVCFSGGHSSAIVAIMVAQRYPKDTILLNHDINPKYEHVDIKRFKKQVADYIGLPITYANINGLEVEKIPNQFDISRKVKAFKSPGTGDALCTYHLKTKPFNQYLAKNFPLGEFGKCLDCIIYYGFDDDEQSRINRRKMILWAQGYTTEFPLANWPATIEDTSEIGIPRPATYSVFKHGNCFGCLKARMQHWYVVYCIYPEIYAEGVSTEKELGYTLMRTMELGILRPISLEELSLYFEKMKQAGIEASEHAPRGPFLKALREFKLSEIQQDNTPCECFSL